MVEAERKLPEGERIDFVSIVTPNSSHYEIARAFIEAGFHVVCDKPMTTTIEDAEELCRIVKKQNAVFALTHNYTGYPMVKQARALVRQGKLGDVKKIVAEYPQGWLAGASGINMWRLDPKLAGISSAVGDIGVHAHNLARYVTGLEIEALCADIATFGKGYDLEDDASVLVRWKGGARGIIYVSQISVGEENGLRLRVYGTKAGLDWRQENPNYLEVLHGDGPVEVHRRGNDYLEPVVRHNTRIPFGHPEGFIEGFANVYRNAGRTIAARIAGDKPGEFDTDFPTAQDGAHGVVFIHKVIESGKKKAWVDVNYAPPGA